VYIAQFVSQGKDDIERLCCSQAYLDRNIQIDSLVEKRARIFKRLWGPGIDSKELILPAIVAWRAGTVTLFLLGS
jgi:hypothetical protein